MFNLKLSLLGLILTLLIGPAFASGNINSTAQPGTVAEWIATNPEAPKFKDYPVKNKTFKPIKKADLTSSPDGRLYRTAIGDGFKRGVAFAGKYAVADAGCGTQCMTYWIINMETGKIIFSVDAQLGASYKKDSSLFILNSDSDTDGTDMNYVSRAVDVEFYQVKDDKVTLIKKLLLPDLEQQ